MANTLVFVDLPTSDPPAAQRFYERLFGWEIKGRPEGDFHQILPGEGLHLGLFSETTQTPDPDPRPQLGRQGLHPRTYILVDERPATMLERAARLGAQPLWDERWWDEFSGYHASFRDPWGNQIVLWWRGESPGADEEAATVDLEQGG